MKLLASITIVMAIPTMISGLFGMNVQGIPFEQYPHGFWLIVAMVCSASLLAIFVLNKKDMF
jgi:magnesium transporter